MCFHYSLTLGSNYLANNSVNFQSLIPWLNLTAYALYVLCGFIAGILSNAKYIVVGSVAGIISAATAVVIFGVGGEAFGMFTTLISGLILGSVGGSLSLLFKGKPKNAL